MSGVSGVLLVASGGPSIKLLRVRMCNINFKQIIKLNKPLGGGDSGWVGFRRKIRTNIASDGLPTPALVSAMTRTTYSSFFRSSSKNNEVFLVILVFHEVSVSKYKS